MEREESVSAGADEARDSGRGICRWTVWESSMPDSVSVVINMAWEFMRHRSHGIVCDAPSNSGERKLTNTPSLHIRQTDPISLSTNDNRRVLFRHCIWKITISLIE